MAITKAQVLEAFEAWNSDCVNVVLNWATSCPSFEQRIEALPESDETLERVKKLRDDIQADSEWLNSRNYQRGSIVALDTVTARLDAIIANAQQQPVTRHD